MARTTTAKQLTRVFKQLDDEDRERVLKHAKRLSEESGTGEAQESLIEGDTTPSYTATVGDKAYKTAKKRQKREEKQQERLSWG